MAIEFFGRIYKKIYLYDPQKSKFSTWITRSMQNFMIEYWKRKQRNPKKESLEKQHNIVDPSENIIKKLETKTHRELIRRMIASLGPEDTRMFNEVLLKGRTQTEVAKDMGVKRSTFDYRFQRLRRRLEKFRPEDF